MIKFFKHICGGIKAVIIIAFVFILFPFARLFLWKKRIWLVSEFGYEARDNGYSFFKYMRKEHPEINCYYAIDFKSSDYPKIQELANAIRFGSFKHYAYWCAARYMISSKTNGFCPNYYITLLRKKIHLWGKYVFLQHGITKDDQKFLYKKASKIDLFICGAEPEYRDIKAKYGYGDNEVAYTGFARFDDYHKISTKKQIFVMPTWRRYAENVNFVDTEYYKTWSSFINSNELNDFLVKNSINLYFYLHPHFRKQENLFKTECTNIMVLPFNKIDIQSLIRDSILFVTDFSSLAFDFAYMKKPVLYYQYDEEAYFKGHYIKGYFDYRRDGFGPVCNDFESLLQQLRLLEDAGFNVDEMYINRTKKFFPLHDDKNCSRIFESILKL